MINERNFAKILIASNLVTASVVLLCCSDLIRRMDVERKKLYNNAKLNHKAVTMFVDRAPYEVSKSIMDDIQFDWVVKDL